MILLGNFKAFWSLDVISLSFVYLNMFFGSMLLNGEIKWILITREKEALLLLVF